MYSVYIIGVGGVGGFIVDRLPETIASLTLDWMERTGQDSSEMVLARAGDVVLPRLVDKLVLVEKDVFEPHNAIRQGAGLGNKLNRRLKQLLAAVKAKIDEGEAYRQVMQTHHDLLELANMLAIPEDRQDALTDEDMRVIRNKLVTATFLRDMRIQGYNAYIRPDNMESIITPEWDKNRICDATPVVFLCVDNMKTRYEVLKYMEQFKNCIVINGGNDKTKGQVLVYERQDGAELDPPMYKVYSNIRPDVDKRPDELGCEAVSPTHSQTAETNAFLADIMLAKFIQRVKNSTLAESITRKGVKSDVRYNEVQVDTTRLDIIKTYNRKEDYQ